MTTKPAPKPAELAAAKLRWRCELSRIPFETTAQADPREGFIGQERALRALKMGVELSAPGYNVFVSNGMRESSHLQRSFAAASSAGFGAGFVVMKSFRARYSNTLTRGRTVGEGGCYPAVIGGLSALSR